MRMLGALLSSPQVAAMWCDDDEEDEEQDDDEQDEDKEEDVISGSCRPHINRFLPCCPVTSRGKSVKVQPLLLRLLLL